MSDEAGSNTEDLAMEDATAGRSCTWTETSLSINAISKDIRDGEKAEEYASLASQFFSKSGWGHCEVVQAAAFAEEHYFLQAIKLEKEYQNTPGLSAKEIAESRERLKLYEAHPPYRSKAPLPRSMW